MRVKHLCCALPLFRRFVRLGVLELSSQSYDGMVGHHGM